MSAVVHDPEFSQREIPAFPPWLDLPPDYLVQDWIAWQKGRLVASKLRSQPSLMEVAKNRLMERREKKGLYGAEQEWLDLLNDKSTEEVAVIMETPDHEGQRLRSSSPFYRQPFVDPQELEVILERAYGG